MINEPDAKHSLVDTFIDHDTKATSRAGNGHPEPASSKG